MERLRADGQVIREGMRIEQIAALGGMPCKVVDARWRWNEQRFVITNPLGLLAMVVADRRWLAVLWNTDESALEADLKATVDTARREDWILDQVDRGIDVLITNPELVKTGLDLLDFPTIAFLQTGYNVYTLQQAARRS